MNCLTEAIGLALPGNGSTLATHAARKALFERGRPRWSSTSPSSTTSGDDASVLPRAIATRDAFENAVALDVAMGGSTNTVLHLLAAAREAELDFGVADIDAISRRVPCLAKVAPEHAEVPHGGRAPGRRHPGASSASSTGRPAAPRRARGALARPGRAGWPTWDIRSGSADAPRPSSCSTPRPAACAPPSRSPPTNRWATLDTDAAERLHPRRASTPTPPTAAWPSCSATSRRTAAW